MTAHATAQTKILSISREGQEQGLVGLGVWRWLVNKLVLHRVIRRCAGESLWYQTSGRKWSSDLQSGGKQALESRMLELLTERRAEQMEDERRVAWLRDWLWRNTVERRGWSDMSINTVLYTVQENTMFKTLNYQMYKICSRGDWLSSAQLCVKMW